MELCALIASLNTIRGGLGDQKNAVVRSSACARAAWRRKDLPLDRRIASFEHDLPAIELTWSVRYLYVNGTMPQLDFALSVRDSTTGSAVYLPPPR